MKNNRKNRALRYIQRKNGLNKGDLIAFNIRHTLEIKDVEAFIQHEAEHECNKLSKRYKMKFKVLKLYTGQTSQDFMDNLATTQITLVKN